MMMVMMMMMMMMIYRGKQTLIYIQIDIKTAK